MPERQGQFNRSPVARVQVQAELHQEISYAKSEVRQEIVQATLIHSTPGVHPVR
jgi:hypothetical protein